MASRPTQLPLASSEISAPHPLTCELPSADNRNTVRAGSHDQDCAVFAAESPEPRRIGVGFDDDGSERVRLERAVGRNRSSVRRRQGRSRRGRGKGRTPQRPAEFAAPRLAVRIDSITSFGSSRALAGPPRPSPSDVPSASARRARHCVPPPSIPRKRSSAMREPRDDCPENRPKRSGTE